MSLLIRLKMVNMKDFTSYPKKGVRTKKKDGVLKQQQRQHKSAKYIS